MNVNGQSPTNPNYHLHNIHEIVQCCWAAMFHCVVYKNLSFFQYRSSTKNSV